jgi:peptidoglycan/LPS O-acetylase OafA/YrhL
MSLRFRTDVQGLRAVAILFVMVFHSGLPLNGGFVGVDIFFVISGFVIATKLITEHIETGSISLASFYRGRFNRLFPALSFMLTFVLLASALILSPIIGQLNLVRNAVAAIFSSANIMILHTTGSYFDLPSETNPLLNTWSLSVEEQFYFVFPIFLIFIYRRNGWRKSASDIYLLLILSSLSFLIMSLTTNNFLYGIFGFYSPISRAWEFGIGVIIAIIDLKYKYESKFFSVISVIGLISVVLSPFFIHASEDLPNFKLLVPTLGSALLILFGEKTLAGKVLSIRLLQNIGKYSYQFYLWHWPFLVFAMYLFPRNNTAKFIFIFISFIPAVISYRFIETPFRRHSERKLVKDLGLVIGIPLMVAISLYVSSYNSFWSENIKEFKLSIGEIHAGREHGCFVDTPFSELELIKCTWNSQGIAEPIYLLGDSNAEQFSEAVIAVGKVRNSPVLITGASACPFFGGYLEFPNQTAEWNKRCQNFNKENLEFLIDAKPGIVVIGNIDSYFYASSGNSIGIGYGSDSIEFSYYKRNAKLEAVLRQTLKSLKTSGHKIILIQTIPNWVESSWWEPYWCTNLKIYKGACGQAMTKSEAISRQGEIRDLIRKLGSTSDIYILDTWKRLCPGEVCMTQPNQYIAYKDGSHISVQESKRFTREFEEAFKVLTN